MNLKRIMFNLLNNRRVSNFWVNNPLKINSFIHYTIYN